MRTLSLQNMVSSSAQILSQCKIRLNFKDTFSINANHGDWSDHSVVKKKKSLRFSYQLRRFQLCWEKRPILEPHFASTQSEVTHHDRILRQRTKFDEILMRSTAYSFLPAYWNIANYGNGLFCTVSDTITTAENCSKCMGIFKSLIPNKVRTIDFLRGDTQQNLFWSNLKDTVWLWGEE